MDGAEQGKYALDINSTAAKLLWALSKRESREGQSVKEVSSTLWWESVKSEWVKIEYRKFQVEETVERSNKDDCNDDEKQENML